MLKIKQLAQSHAKTCPYCHDDFIPKKKLTSCLDCRALIHMECWQEHPSCMVCHSTSTQIVKLTRSGDLRVVDSKKGHKKKRQRKKGRWGQNQDRQTAPRPTVSIPLAEATPRSFTIEPEELRTGQNEQITEDSPRPLRDHPAVMVGIVALLALVIYSLKLLGFYPEIWIHVAFVLVILLVFATATLLVYALAWLASAPSRQSTNSNLDSAQHSARESQRRAQSHWNQPWQH